MPIAYAIKQCSKRLNYSYLCYTHGDLERKLNDERLDDSNEAKIVLQAKNSQMGFRDNRKYCNDPKTSV